MARVGSSSTEEFADADPASAIKLRRHRLQILYSHLSQGLITTIIVAAIVAYVQSGQVGIATAATWFTVMGCVVLMRVGIWAHFKRTTKSDENVIKLHRLFAFGVVANAMVWAGMSIFLFPPDNVAHQAFLGFVVSGMTAGAMGTFAASHRIFLLYMVPTCATYATQLFLQGGRIQWAMGAMTIAFVIATWLTSRKAYRATREALTLRYRNLGLLHRLERANESLRGEIHEREQAQHKMKALMEEATAATRAKSEFLANMSHEIRTPMNGVIGMADILSRSELDRRQRHQLSLIQNSAQTLLSLLNSILDLSRIEAGRLELDATPFNFREITGDAIDILAEQAETKGIELAYVIANDIGIIAVGDQVRLRQVLINLLGNAVKFTEEGSVVLRVTNAGTDEDGRTLVHFSIVDTGIGIDPAVKANLFDPFRQADPTVTRRFGGSGLGLSIAHHIVDLMGGELACSSVPGHGSEFHFTIPLTIRARQREKTLSFPPRLAGSRVLVADENTVTLDIVATYLTSWSLDAQIAETGAEVLAELEKSAVAATPFAAVVASASLSDMSGLELAARIRSHTAIRSTRLILLTPVNWQVDLKLLEARAITGVVNKPVRQSHLFEALSKAISETSRDGATTAPAVSPTPGSSVTATLTFRAHVLVVEDNLVNQEVVITYLRDLGCSLDVVTNGQAALDAIDAQDFDLIFMDCQMPSMDGYSTTEEIRRRERETGRTRTPVVALTAGAFAGDRERCLRAGMDAYISKPFDQGELESTLREWLPANRVLPPPAPTDNTASAPPAHHPERRGVAAPVPALDAQQVGALRARDAQLFRRLVALYRGHTPALIQDIETAERCSDCAALRLAAHALKSSSANVAATNLAELCQLLEVHAQCNDLISARRTLNKIRAEYERVRIALDAAVDEAAMSEHRNGGSVTITTLSRAVSCATKKTDKRRDPHEVFNDLLKGHG